MFSTLAAAGKAVLVSSNMPKGLVEPKEVIGSDGVLFGDLVGWGARVAVGGCGYPNISGGMVAEANLALLTEIFEHRRENWLKSEVYDRAAELDDIAEK